VRDGLTNHEKTQLPDAVMLGPQAAPVNRPVLIFAVPKIDLRCVLLCDRATLKLPSRDYYDANHLERVRDFDMAQMSGNYSPEVQEAIRRRATELYQSSGGVSGQDAENWFQAEAEVLRESAGSPIRRAIVVNVQGVVYTGEYECTSAEGYLPGEWKPGDPIPVRLAGNKLYLRRPNGRELQTTIVKRIG